MVSRRQFIAGAAGITGLGLVGLKPADHSGLGSPYFSKLRSALLEAEIATPTLVVDVDKLEKNVATLLSHLPEGMDYRVVAKSLPSPELIKRVATQANTKKLMTFNLPMLESLSQDQNFEQLLGKPLPVLAAKQFLAAGHDTNNIQWLVDTEVRAKQYAELAKQQKATLKLNLEIDVGLHRGGFTPEQLPSVLKLIEKSPDIEFSGFMGYEPHIASLPTALGMRSGALQDAWKIYAESLAIADEVFSQEQMASITRNAAGSPTYRLYEDTKIANEVSVGSALVKPTGFDRELLSDFQPASFIASPVIKGTHKTQLPGIESLADLQSLWDPNTRNAVFIYGGNWLADPVDPPGLQTNPVFGRSSNQEMLNGGNNLDLDADDYVFFRPKQSEAVFMQFGDIALYQDGKITGHVPVFKASA